MSDPHWFKLLVRGVGILLLGLAIPSALQAIASVSTIFDPVVAPQDWNGRLWLMTHTLSALVQLGFGIYLVFGAPRLVRYCVRQVYSRCGACDYDVRGLRGVCPECGVSIPEASDPGHQQAP